MKCENCGNDVDANVDDSTYNYHRKIGETLNALGITLNDRPASVMGFLNRFATVRNVDGVSGEWAWPTLARMVNGGARRLSL